MVGRISKIRSDLGANIEHVLLEGLAQLLRRHQKEIQIKSLKGIEVEEQ